MNHTDFIHATEHKYLSWGNPEGWAGLCYPRRWSVYWLVSVSLICQALALTCKHTQRSRLYDSEFAHKAEQNHFLNDKFFVF